MKHPGISKPEKLAIIRKVFQGNVSKELEGFFEVVVSKDRYRDLPAIFSYFTEKVKEKQKIGVAYVTTAIRLTPEQEKAVEGKLACNRRIPENGKCISAWTPQLSAE